MAEFDFTLTAAPPLGGVEVTLGENRIAERAELALVSVAVPLGGRAELEEALRDAWGLALPAPTMTAQAGEMRAISTAPDQFLLLFPHQGPDAETLVATALRGKGYTTLQTDGWVMLELSGPNTLAALERLCPIDCASLPVGGSARSVIEHVGAILLRLGPDRFLALSASSSARSFLHAVESSYRYVT